MLVQLREVEEFLRETIRLATFSTLVEELLETLVLRRDHGQLLVQVSYTVVILSGVLVPYELAVVAPEDYCWAIGLVLENVLVCGNLFASSISIAALKLDLGE